MFKFHCSIFFYNIIYTVFLPRSLAIIEEKVQYYIILYIQGAVLSVMTLSDHKDVFGAPMTGVHSIRMFGVAIVDVAFTFIAGFVLAYIFGLNLRQCCLLILVLFALGVVIHRVFSVNTRVNVAIFGKV